MMYMMKMVMLNMKMSKRTTINVSTSITSIRKMGPHGVDVDADVDVDVQAQLDVRGEHKEHGESSTPASL